MSAHTTVHFSPSSEEMKGCPDLGTNPDLSMKNLGTYLDLGTGNLGTNPDLGIDRDIKIMPVCWYKGRCWYTSVCWDESASTTHSREEPQPTCPTGSQNQLAHRT